MKLTTALAVAALIAAPTVASAQKSNSTLPNQPGQSEYAPGQRAQTGNKDAKDYAPGQRMKEKDVKGQPGASEYAPGNLPNKDVRK
jgi:hypothetical protein